MTDEDDPFAPPPRKLKTVKGIRRPTIGGKHPVRPKLRLVHGATPAQPQIEDDPFASPPSSVTVTAEPWSRQEPENPFPDPRPTAASLPPVTLRKHSFGDPFTDELSMPFVMVSQKLDIEIIEVSADGMKTIERRRPPYCDAIGEMAERIAVARNLVLVTGVQAAEVTMAIEDIIKLTADAVRATGRCAR